MNYIIEFTGIPGSGKTYLSDCIVERLAQTLPGDRVYDREKIYLEKNEHGFRQFISGLKILFTPVYFKMFAKLILKKQFAGERRAKLKYLIKILLQQKYVIEKIKKHDNLIILLDEGFVHLQYIFFERYKDEKSKVGQLVLLKKLLQKYKDAKLVNIFVNNEVKTSFERIESREQGWPACFSCDTEEAKIGYLEEQYNIFGYLKKALSDLCNVCLTSHESDKCIDFIMGVISEKQ